MQDTFFNYGLFDEEIAKKLESRSANSDDLFAALIDFLRTKNMSAADLKIIDQVYRELMAGTDYASESRHYLSHPIRVAHDYAQALKNVKVEDVTLALCHNLKEKMGASFDTLTTNLISPKTRRLIGILTIERDLETDDGYLETFYNGIATERSGLMLLKALDKLDNTLSWVLFEVKSHEPKVILEQVCPRIIQSHPALEQYLRELTLYVLSPEAKEKFRNATTKS